MEYYPCLYKATYTEAKSYGTSLHQVVALHILFLKDTLRYDSTIKAIQYLSSEHYLSLVTPTSCFKSQVDLVSSHFIVYFLNGPKHNS
jgi:hypothetical protein